MSPAPKLPVVDLPVRVGDAVDHPDWHEAPALTAVCVDVADDGMHAWLIIDCAEDPDSIGAVADFACRQGAQVVGRSPMLALAARGRKVA